MDGRLIRIKRSLIRTPDTDSFSRAISEKFVEALLAHFEAQPQAESLLSFAADNRLRVS